MIILDRRLALLFLIGCRDLSGFVIPVSHRSQQMTTFNPISSKHQNVDRGLLIAAQNNQEEKRQEEKDDDDDEEKESSLVVGGTSTASKLRMLKDRMWVRETLEDLTSAEFACSLAPRTASDEKSGVQKKSSVDFENILLKLDRRIEDMCTLSTYEDNNSDCIIAYPLDKISLNTDEQGSGSNSEKECWSLMKNSGMGSVTYTDDQRSALITRILKTRENLVKAMAGISTKPEIDFDQLRETLQTPDVVEEETNKSTGDPYLYIRDDGTIDWDGALQDRAALKQFGISVWARINGQDADSLDEDSVDDIAVEPHGNESKRVTVKIAETEAIRNKRELLHQSKKELNDMETEHTALLNSAVQAGSAIANVKMARLDPEMRQKIRTSDDELQRKRDMFAFHSLNYELERIFTYLDGELGNTSTQGYIPLQDRLNVAEFGLLESQIDSLNRQLTNGEPLDSDVLSVVVEQMTDFKRRLGIDYYVTGLSFDQEAIKLWAKELLQKSQNGLVFYGKGLQLLWNDVVFSLSLIGKALQGYTLKPREVRTLRRTFKDILTFIPFVIILIIPLTPIGHVLVFGAIQRFFPDFFPSCFTESRQNLLSLYESAEFSAYTIEENWQQKLTRATEAAGYTIVDYAKKMMGLKGEEDNDS